MKTPNGNLWYSKKDSRLFYISDFYDNGTRFLSWFKKNIAEAEALLRQYAPEGEIYADEIKKSKWCQGKWYYAVELPEAPAGVKVIEQSMWDYIE